MLSSLVKLSSTICTNGNQNRKINVNPNNIETKQYLKGNSRSNVYGTRTTGNCHIKRATIKDSRNDKKL